MSTDEIMRVFQLLPDDSGWGMANNYEIEASRVWGLPGLRCSSCGTWTVAGVAYPSVDLSSEPDEGRLRVRPPVTADEFAPLKELIEEHLPVGYAVGPGAGFGPLAGTRTGPDPHVLWQNPWTLLLRSDVRMNLLANGYMPTTTKANLAKQTGSTQEYFEIEAPAVAQLAATAFQGSQRKQCPQCRRDLRRAKELIVDRSSVPGELPFFRCIEWPAPVLCSWHVKTALESMVLDNLLFSEVQTDEP